MHKGISIGGNDSLGIKALKRVIVYFYAVPRVTSLILFYVAESRSNYSVLMLFLLLMNVGLLIWYVFINNNQKILPLKNEIWELTIPSITLMILGHMLFIAFPEPGTATAY